MALIAAVSTASASPATADFTCAATAQTGCLAPSGAAPQPTRLWINEQASHTRDNIVFKWFYDNGGQPILFPDATGNDYAFCLYQGTSGGPTSLVFAGRAPAGEQCGSRPCWRATNTDGYKYRDGAATPDGVTKINLFPQPDGRGRIIVKGRGPNLHLPDLALPLPIVVQLQSEAGACFEAEFLASGVSRNDGRRFRGTADD